MTRNGMIQPLAAGAQPAATDPRVSMVIPDAEKASVQTSARPTTPRGGTTKRSVRIHLRASNDGGPPPTPAKIRNPHSYRLCPAGSFLGDFRTPAGARNSSRKPTVGSQDKSSG